MPNFSGNIINMSGIASAISRMGQRLYSPPPNAIAGIDASNWPTANQPVAPLGPPGSQPLQIPFWFGQNLNYNPRPDATYTAADLKALSQYFLARICIDNTKDVLGQIPWNITLRQMPGETLGDVKSRRRQKMKGDEAVTRLSKFLERPSPEHDWEQFLRLLVEDMLTIDAGTVFVERSRGGRVLGMRPYPGELITRYIDDRGFTPQPPSPAYVQLYEGMPRCGLTTDQLIYRPRNFVHRPGMISSYLYGCSSTETIAEEIKIGSSRHAYVMAYYSDGAVGNVIQVVPPNITPDKLLEHQRTVNAALAGNFKGRRQWFDLPGFQRDREDQIIQAKEPVLADFWDETHLRRVAFAYGTSPQRLQKMMNRGSAQTSQSAALEEGIKPFLDWVRRYVNYILQIQMGADEYEIEFQQFGESNYALKARADTLYVNAGCRTRAAIAAELGDDPVQSEYYDMLTITTPNGVVPLGSIIQSGKGGDGNNKPSPAPTPVPAPQKVNGVDRSGNRLVLRGE